MRALKLKLRELEALDEKCYSAIYRFVSEFVHFLSNKWNK